MSEISVSRLKKVTIVRESLPKIAAMLSDQKVDFVQRGTNAHVEYNDNGEPIRVVVPVIPDNASDRFLDAIQGFLDHEVAHLIFSDSSVLMESKFAGKKVAALQNILEDVYIEKRMSKKFIGSRRNLSNTRKFFSEDYIQPLLEELEKKEDATEQEWWNTLCACALRALGGQPELEEFMDGKWEKIPNILKALEPLKDKIEGIECSEDALGVALKINSALYEKPPRSDDGDEEEEQEDEGKGKGDEESDEESSDDSESDEGGSEGDSDSDEEKESDSDDKEDSDSDSDSDEEGGEGDADGDDQESTSEMAHGDQETPDDTPALLEDHDGSDLEDFDSGLEKMLKQIASTEVDTSNYTPYSNEKDVIGQLDLEKHKPDKHWLERVDEEVGHMIRPLTRSLERIFVANNRSRFESGKRSGRIAPANLARLVTDDDRVFRTKEITKTKEVAVQIVIDCSGSMCGEKSDLASKVGLALTEVLTRLKINHEVIGFTTDSWRHGTCMKTSKVSDEDRRLFDRWEPLFIPVFKAFGEQYSVQTKERLSTIARGEYLCENIDGESIAIAASRLLKQKEPGKTMLVLSDGMPSCSHSKSAVLNSHLKSVVKSLEKGGIDVIGLGILTEAPRKFYERHIIVNELADLPEKVVAELSRIVLQAA